MAFGGFVVTKSVDEFDSEVDEEMRKRRKRVGFCCIWVSIATVTAVLYFSTLIEVSYYLRLNKRSLSLYEQFVAITKSGDSNESDGYCQTIVQLALVCAGIQRSHLLSPLIKSILHYRQHAVVLHLLVDDVALKILSKLFITWQLPAVEVIYYNASKYTNRVSWISNRHYSGNYGFLKLILNDILPPDLEKVIVLDTDVLLVDDIIHLWSYFRKMNTLQAIGLVENLSDWYLFNDSTLNRKSWPAWGRGFNTGVMLLDLTKLRSMNWTRLCKNAASENVQKFGPTELADQDVINAVINDHPWIVRKLPCEWNFQMGFQSQQNLCPVEISHLKLVHWNSPLKMKTVNCYAIFFRRYYDRINDMDGNLFRTSRIRCHHSFDASSAISKVYEYDDNDDGCAEMRHARWITYRTQLYIRPYNFTVAPGGIVLATQFSLDRLLHFDALLQYWTGPISAAVYVSDPELSLLHRHFDDTNMLANRTNVALHAVYKEGMHYPINYLRNVALNSSAEAAFVFLADVDFIPRPDLYMILRQKLAVTTDPANKTAFVVPAFEYIGNRFPAVPRTKNELLAELDIGRIQIFRQEIWIQGHAATNYDRWRNADREYSVAWRSEYEPYVVVQPSQVPPYDQRFVGFGWNKVSHMMSLNAAGFKFIVLPDAFVVHQPHLPSFEMAHYRLLPIYRKCLKALKGEFVRDLIREQKRKHMSNYSKNSLN